MTWKVVGHEWAVEALRKDAATGAPAHAYLFLGPPGIGKRTLAMAFAQALNCLHPPTPGESCGACRSCRGLRDQTHPDLHRLQSPRPNEAIRVEAARDLIHALSLRPREARFKIALLLNFQLATSSAANALLKTLEEPAPDVVLLLTAPSAEELLPTIVSRCRLFHLRPIPTSTVASALRGQWGLPPEQAELWARLSCGRLGWAVSQIQDPQATALRAQRSQEWARIPGQSRRERFALAEELSADKDRTAKERIVQALDLWASLTRDLLLCLSAPDLPVANLDYEEEIRGLAGRVSLDQSEVWLQALLEAQRQIEHNVSPRLAVEISLLSAPRA
ncbi:MAG: DNA polymerase III subunit delta' [Anaerolineales bacterium]